MPTTFTTYVPFDAGAGSNVYEDGWRQMQRRTGTPGPVRDQLNGLSCFADSTGMQVKVTSGEVWAEGHWGQMTGQTTLAIASNATGGTRRDLVIWRVKFGDNIIELDVLTGASGGVEPTLTRNSSIFEGPIAVVEVPNGAVTIASTAVLDTRWFGGPTTPTIADDFALFGDKISTCRRIDVNTAEGMVSGAGSGTAYVTLTQCQRDATVTMIRYYIQTLRVAGFRDLRVYTGFSRHRLIDRTTNINPSDAAATGGTADRVHSDALPAPLTISAGQYVAFAYLCTDVSTQPTFGRTAANVIGGGTGEILNPSAATLDPLGRWTNVFKATQTTLPSTLQIHVDNNWSKRPSQWWFALA